MNPSSTAKIIFAIGVVSSLALASASAIMYVLESPYTGMLPVISYPLRQYSLPTAIVGAVVVILTMLTYFAFVRRE